MLRKWYHKLFGKENNQRVRLRPRVRLHLEALEDRVVPASFTVTSTADDGSAGTLRYAIAQANASSDATNTISFDLGAGAQTIVLTQGALALNNSHSTTIQGTGADQLFISGNHTTGVFSIGSAATVELDNLTIEDGSSYNGGGIYNSGNLTINNSILSGNTANAGGGIYDYNYATATIDNSTLSGNSARVGGGIFNFYYSTTTIDNSTLSGNTASGGGNGGGIYNYSNATAKLGNSIVAGNTASNAADVYGSFNSLGHNLIGIANGSSGFTNGVNGDLVGSAASPLDPKLGSLANNGGPTQTMALLTGSPAINAGSNDLIPIDPSTGQPFTTDQRGDPRIVGSSVDIGAFESDVQQSSQTITFNPLPDRTYGDADFALTATASSGLPVSYTATGNATVYQDSNGNWFAHITGAGTATITASQAGNSNYFAAQNVSQTFSIAKATPTVPTPTVPSNAVYNGQPQGATVGDVTGVNNTDLGAPTLTYYVGTYTLATLPTSGGSSIAPTDAGNYTVVASYAGSTDYKAASSLATYSIDQATTDLSNLTVQQIILGSSTTTVSGQLTSNTIVPVGQSVSITLNGVTQFAPVGPDGTFSVSFATGGLGVGAYTINYSYAGDNNFTAATGTGSLTVAYGSQLLFNNSKPVHSGAVLPVKLELTDANGSDVSSPSIAVTAVSLVDSHGNPVPLNSAGNANPNGLFRYDSSLGGYIFNLDTKGLAAGTYTLYYTAGNDPTQHSLTFVVD